MSNTLLTEQLEDVASDDSPFLSMADFFSLISMSLIYVMLVFSPQSPASDNAIDAITGAATGVGPASPIDSKLAYVALFREDAGFLIRLVRAGSAEVVDRRFGLSTTGQISAKEWLLAALRDGAMPQKVMFYMAIDEQRADTHKLFHELVSATQQLASVSMVFLNQPGDAPF